MHKVTTINLNGKAYQLEEKGYTELNAYLTAAGAALADNPDKKEILADIEQAIADKCERFLHDNKDVIDSEQVQTILDEMGPVETDDSADSKQETISNQTARKLYLIPNGGLIAGVCNGIAAYIGVDVTIIRIVFIVLTFATGGFWIFTYLLLMFFLPTARTDEQLAEAYGRRVSAQEIIEGAKGRAKELEPALNNVGGLIRKLVTFGFGIGAAIIAIVLALMTVTWVSLVWYIIFGHLELHGQMVSISHWTIALGVTASYFVVALPLAAIALAGQRVARHQEITPVSRNFNLLSIGLWLTALATLAIVSISVGGRTYDYVETHKGYLDVNNSHLCVDDAVADCNVQNDGRDAPKLLAPPQPQFQ